MSYPPNTAPVPDKPEKPGKTAQAKADAEAAIVLRKYIVSQGHKDPGPDVSLPALHALAHALQLASQKSGAENEPMLDAEDATDKKMEVA